MQRGFSLLEVTLALGISGIMMSAIWQLMGMQSEIREGNTLASQAYAVAQAGQSYINANTSALLGLAQLSAINGVARIKLTASDSGDTTTNLQDSGFLPGSVSLANTFNQGYALYVQRQDGGAVGVDASDKLIGLLVTTGGTSIGDKLGTRTATAIGAAGGFIRSGTSVASGTAGGWSIDFANAAGWKVTPGAAATAGHLAVLTVMLANAPSMGGGVSGSMALNDLTDAKTDYSTDLNLFAGANAGDAIAAGGQNNTAFGIYALRALTTGDNNTALGLNAGSTLVDGSSNILLGANTQPPATSTSNFLNIGNRIYGDLSTGQLNIGSSTFTTDIGFDDGVNTKSSRLAVGNVAQRPSCTSLLEGAQRWNSQTQNMELCTGGAWVQPTPAWTSVSGTPPTANPGSGYFVMTHDTWNGNLGGMAGANAKCLSDLTSYTWQGKVTANARGQLDSTHVKAFVCPASGTCNDLVPLTTYYFARSGSLSSGGGNFTTDSNGQGPLNNYSWAAANYFDSTQDYWTSRWGYSTAWTYYSALSMIGWANACNTWTSSSSSDATVYGVPTSIDSGRYATSSGSTGCNTLKALICVVNP